MSLAGIASLVHSFTNQELLTSGWATVQTSISAFLSHSSQDESQVKLIQHFLKAIGIEPWVSYDDIHNPEHTKEIAKQIRTNDIFLLILSNAAINSRYVQIEIHRAFKLEKPIIIYELEVTRFPEDMEFLLDKYQRIFAHKFPIDSLERLARIIINELCRDKWPNYKAKVREEASKLRQEQLEAEKEYQRKLSEYKEYYWNCRTRKGKHKSDAAISVNDRETLNHMQLIFGLTDEDISKVRSRFDQRKKREFTRILSNTLSQAEVTRENLYTLERKRLDYCVSREEVEENIHTRKRIPALRNGNSLVIQDDKSAMPAIDVEWIVNLLKCAKEKPHSIVAPASKDESEASSPLRLQETEQSKVAISQEEDSSREQEASERAAADQEARKENVVSTTKKPSLRRKEDSTNINQVSVKALYGGLGRNEDANGLIKINKEGSKAADDLDAYFILNAHPSEVASGVTRVLLVSVEDREEKLDLKIPAGINTGKRLRLKGRGNALSGKARGDLYLVINICEDQSDDPSNKGGNSSEKPKPIIPSFSRSDSSKANNNSIALLRSDKDINNSKQVLEIDPKDATALLNRGCSKADLGEKQGAIADFNQALALDPKNSDAFFYRGYAKYDIGDKKGAIADYDQALAIDPKNAHAFFNRGFAKAELGDKQGAIADYDKALAIDPNDAIAFFNRGVAKDDLGDKKGAIADFSQTLALDPMNALAFFYRGYAKYDIGDKKGAIADYDQAL
ncbi:tetratricopeptide repeat protein, partial [Cyanobium sp. FGCU-52]|nr:tetratricopeptide repeat protein [Cyanobium sp. FGCU52]